MPAMPAPCASVGLTMALPKTGNILWPPGNNTFASAPELVIFILHQPGVLLALRAGAGRVHKQSIFEPGEPQCANALRLFQWRFHMLVARLLIPSLLLLAGSALAGTPPYDGVWDVTVETRTGSCELSAQYRLTVQDGKISGPANIAGTVAHEGMVKVSINGAYAFGQLVGKAGSGKWNAAATGKPCSGRWQATKE